MAAPRSASRLIVGTAAGVAILVPATLLHRGTIRGSAVPPPVAAQADRGPVPSLAAAIARPLFFARPAPGDLQSGLALSGIVGRLPDQGVALVRDGHGRMHALKAGDTVDGWRLDGLFAESATFTRGGRRIEIGLPAR